MKFKSLLLTLALTLSGCTTIPQGQLFNQNVAGSMNYNEQITVLAFRPVVIEAEHQSNVGQYVGATVGAGLGGLAFSHIGKGNGKTAATIRARRINIGEQLAQRQTINAGFAGSVGEIKTGQDASGDND